MSDESQVMVSTSGSQLLAHDAIKGLLQHLLPVATILTPNIPEARLLLEEAGVVVQQPRNVEDLVSLSKAVQGLGPKYVLIKGGHLPLKRDGTAANSDEEREIVIDVLYGDGVETRVETDYQKSKNTHGTGCSLACKSQFFAMDDDLNTGSCYCL